jgi:MoxR-like ATPase
MGERQITIGNKTYPLPALFLVMATQNPIEQEGTYPLPEAQLDRFLLYVKMEYPDAKVEQEILHLARQEASHVDVQRPPTGKLLQSDIFAARKEVLKVHTSASLEQYLVALITATRKPEKVYKELASVILYGASPRATIALDRCAKAHAWLAGRDYVIPEDIHAMVHEVLRHRILLCFEALAEGVSTEEVIHTLLKVVALP